MSNEIEKSALAASPRSSTSGDGVCSSQTDAYLSKASPDTISSGEATPIVNFLNAVKLPNALMDYTSAVSPGLGFASRNAKGHNSRRNDTTKLMTCAQLPLFQLDDLQWLARQLHFDTDTLVRRIIYFYLPLLYNSL